MYIYIYMCVCVHVYYLFTYVRYDLKKARTGNTHYT